MKKQELKEKEKKKLEEARLKLEWEEREKRRRETEIKDIQVQLVRNLLGDFKFFCRSQGCGSGSAWIRILFPSWNRIRYADPDPGGEICQIKNAMKLLITGSFFSKKFFF